MIKQLNLLANENIIKMDLEYELKRIEDLEEIAINNYLVA